MKYYNFRYWFWSYSPRYGNCYTFNTELNTKDTEAGGRVTSQIGVVNGKEETTLKDEK